MLAGLVVLPVFVWNAQHGWASFAFQGSRGVASGGLKPLRVLRIALGQIAFLSPWLFVPLVAGLVSGIRRWRDGRRLFLLCLSLPPIVLFTVAPLWIARGQPHWSMPGWFFAFPLMGAWAQDVAVPVRNLRRYAALSVALLAALSAGAVDRSANRLAVAPFAGGDDRPDPGSPQLDRPREAPLLQLAPSFVISTEWKEAGKIALALGPRVPVFVVSNDPRGWMFVKGGADLVGRDGVLVVRPVELAAVRTTLAPLFASLGEAQPLTLIRRGVPAMELVLVPVKGLKQPPAVSGSPPIDRRRSARHNERKEA